MTYGAARRAAVVAPVYPAKIESPYATTRRVWLAPGRDTVQEEFCAIVEAWAAPVASMTRAVMRVGRPAHVRTFMTYSPLGKGARGAVPAISVAYSESHVPLHR